MRIFNKMKKAMLVVAASLFAVNGAFAESKQFLVAWGNITATSADASGTDNCLVGNAGDTSEGITVTMTGNMGKAYSSAKSVDVTWNGETVSRTTIKASNGVQQTVTMPEGWLATKVTFYSYVNKSTADAADRDCYWSEVGGVAYTTETTTKFACFTDVTDYGKNPDVASFTLDKVSSFTFKQTGYQNCYVMVIDAENETTLPVEPEPAAADSLKAGEVNVLEVGKTYILGKQYTQYQISFTAPADGFLTITPSVTLKLGSININGSYATVTKDAKQGFTKGMEAGSVFTAKYSVYSVPSEENVCSFDVSFKEGVPYTALALQSAAPADGAEWSGAAHYKMTYYIGQPYYEFNTPVNTTDMVASVTVGDKTYTPITLYASGNGVFLKSLPDTLALAISEGKIKAGEKFTVTLDKIADKEFSKNTLATQTFTYTLASTACTGVKSDASSSNLPTYVTFSFDGVVKTDNAKFYYLNEYTGEKTDLQATVDGTDLTITGPTIEGLPSRRYQIVAENVTDSEGKTISYSNDETNYPKEEGKLIFTKALNNSPFNKTVSTVSTDSWSDGYTQVHTFKSFSITWPAPVVLNEAVTKAIVFSKEEEQGGGDWGGDWWAEGDAEGTEGTESEATEITVSHAISETDPCTVIFTLSQEVTELGKYSIEIPSKLYYAKDYYTPEDEDKLNKFGYYSPTIYAYAEVVGIPVADGTYYMKNVASGKFMNGANSWGTRASLCDQGADIAFAYQKSNGTYSLATNWGKGYLGSNGFIDSDKADWILEKQSNGTYLISLDKTNYLGYSEGSTEVNLALPSTAGEAIQWQLITRDELIAGLAEASEINPVDATFFIVGHDFNRDDNKRNATWQGGAEPGGGNHTNWCAEKWNASPVDIYQEITDLPNGYYTLTAQGFYRAGNGGTTATDQNAYLYANEVSVPLVSINSEAGNEAITGSGVSNVEGYGAVPNDRECAGIAFAAGLYAGHNIDVKVTDGKLRVGIKKDVKVDKDWICFDKFRLTYHGAKTLMEAATDSLNTLIAEVEAYQKTLNTEDPTQASMSESLTQAITGSKAVAEAQESVAAVREAYNALNMNYTQIVVYLAGSEAQANQEWMATYTEPTDEAGLANAINKVYEIVSSLSTNMGGTYTVADLNAAVEAMRTAKEAFIVENTPADAAVTTVYDFEDGEILFTCDSRISASVVEGEQTITGKATNTITLESKAVRFACAGNAQNGYSFAHYDFTSLVDQAKTVKVEFDYWNTAGARAIISLGDASVRGTTGNSSKATYSNKGAIFALGSNKDYALLNGASLTQSDYCDKWLAISVTVDVINATYSYSVKDKATGTEIKSESDITYYSSEALTCSQIDLFGYINSSTPALLDNIAITVEKDNRVYADYKVVYVDEAGTEIKEAAVRNGAANDVAGITEADKESFKNTDASKKYIYKSDDSEGKTIAEDGTTVITVTFREAATYNYSVEAVDESGNLMSALGSYSNFEGEKVAAPYNAYVLNEADATLYEAAKNNKEYNQYITLTEDNMKVQVTYTKTTIENVVYYQEAENVEGLTKVTTGNTSVRSSNSASAYAAEADVVLTNLSAGIYKMTVGVYDANKEPNAEFNFVAGENVVMTAKATDINLSISTSEEFTLNASSALSLAMGGNNMQAVDFIYIQKTGSVTPSFDLTAYNEAVAYANEKKATLNAEDETEAYVMQTIDEEIANAATWLEETLAEPTSTQEDVDFIGSYLKEAVDGFIARMPVLKLWPEAEALRMEADSILGSYTEYTDEAGLIIALQSFPRSAMWVTSAEELQTAMDTLKAAMAAFIAENSPKGPKVAYLCGATETTEAIYTALVNAGYDVTPLNYDATALTEEIVNNDFVGKYDVVVLAGATGSGTELAKTANLLVGKVNVLSTKSFWYKHYGTNGTNPGSADAPSLNMTKAAGYEAHPIYSGIEDNEFAVFVEHAEDRTSGRYLQGNGSFADETLAQATIGTTLGADCIGEVWSNGFGYMIIPVDGAQPAGYLTAEGEALFANAVNYLIEGVPYEINAIGNIKVTHVQWPADIYDINGRMVKKAATSLEGLEKGLYLINGKKYIVK